MPLLTGFVSLCAPAERLCVTQPSDKESRSNKQEQLAALNTECMEKKPFEIPKNKSCTPPPMALIPRQAQHTCTQHNMGLPRAECNSNIGAQQGGHLPMLYAYITQFVYVNKAHKGGVTHVAMP